jgi:2-succinyl-5-enolpyruvyl-6-hydroxy-3-cyclohexene-1-carboxylate synthase
MSNLLFENLNRVWCSLIIDELFKNDITHFYLSPGMRNAPLIAALCFYKKLNTEIKIFTCLDERAAGYRALGYSKASGKPCVLLCTSGTAVANYFPAVIEASNSNIPLVVISADRPKEQILSGDNQTIDQNNIFGKFIRAALDLGVPSLDISARDLTTNISNLIAKAITAEKGPVHFNCPFREPLEKTIQAIPDIYLNAAKKQIASPSPATQYLNTVTGLTPDEIKDLHLKLSSSTAGLLIIGSLPSCNDLEPLRQFIKALGWPVYLDVSSSLKYEYSLFSNAIPTFDHPEVLNEMTVNPPDTILHIGGRLTAKHYYTYIKSLDSTLIISLNNNSQKEDPSHHTNIRINSDINFVIGQLAKSLLNEALPPLKRQLDFTKFIEKKRQIIDDSPLSYPLISKTIVEILPQNSLLYIANSTVVRSFDSYCSLNAQKIFTIATNRGVSGIEGFIASACGFSDGSGQDVYLIIGDISLMHDLNSLYFLKNLQNKLKIILINNFGGGIFTLLPISQEEEVLSLITSPHNENFEKIAANFEMNYLKVNEVSELSRSLSQLSSSQQHTLLEIFVDHDLNKKVYDLLRTIKLS